jgi:hypothetical protein
MGDHPASRSEDRYGGGNSEPPVDGGNGSGPGPDDGGYGQRLKDVLFNVNLWVALGTWALAIVGYISLKDTGHIAKKQVKLTLRQISILETQLAPNLTIHWKTNTITDKSGNIVQWLVTPTIQNSGLTRATKFLGWADAHAFERPPDGMLGVDCTVPFHRLVPTGPEIIAGQSSRRLDTVFVSRQNMMDAESHKTMYMMWMQATFQDEFHPAVVHHLGQSIELAPHEIGGKTDISFVISPTECDVSD